MRSLSCFFFTAIVVACFCSNCLAQPQPSQLPTPPLQAPADPIFANGDFDHAEQSYRAALAASSNDAVAAANLARIRLYQDRRADARKLAEQALGIDAENILATRVIASVDARNGAFAPDAYQTEMPKTGVTIKLAATDPLPILRVRVNGKQDVYFLIDTGAPDIVLDKEFAAELGLNASLPTQGTFVGGNRAPVTKANLPMLQIGEVRVSNVPASLLPTRGFALKPGIRIDGIIGTGFLMHFLATIDYPKGELVLHPRSDSASFEKAVANKGATVVPMWLIGDHFIFARGKLGRGPEGQFNIDTGLAGGGLQATRATLNAAGIAVDESQAQTVNGPGGPTKLIPFKADAALGNFTVKNVDGIYTPDGDQYGLFPFKAAGTLSHAFFRQAAITFDFAAMKLVLEAH